MGDMLAVPNFVQFLKQYSEKLKNNFEQYKSDGTRILNDLTPKSALPFPPYLTPYFKTCFSKSIIDPTAFERDRALLSDLEQDDAKEEVRINLLQRCGGTEFVKFIQFGWAIAYYEIVDPKTQQVRQEIQNLIPQELDIKLTEEFIFQLITSYYANIFSAKATDLLAPFSNGPYSKASDLFNMFLNSKTRDMKDLPTLKQHITNIDPYGLEYSILKLRLITYNELFHPEVRKATRNLLISINDAKSEINNQFLGEFLQAAVELIEQPGDKDKCDRFVKYLNDSKLQQNKDLLNPNTLATLGVILLGAVVITASVTLGVLTLGGSLFAGSLAIALLAKIISVIGIYAGLHLTMAGPTTVYNGKRYLISDGKGLFKAQTPEVTEYYAEQHKKALTT